MLPLPLLSDAADPETATAMLAGGRVPGSTIMEVRVAFDGELRVGVYDVQGGRGQSQ